MRLNRGDMNARGGCQCKLGGLDLERLLETALPRPEKHLTGALKPRFEDSAVFEHGLTRLLATTDLAPLVGVDLVAAGRIAALHAMSDIFASGGVPKWALVTLVLSASDPLEHAEDVLSGIGIECAQHGVAILGGQTIIGSETLAGLTVLGVPSNGRILRKGGASDGNVLLMSKPIGTGLVLRGYKLGLLDDTALTSAIEVMSQSNAAASAAALRADVLCCTDISGFGLLGHLSEMLAPQLGATIHLAAVPQLPSVVNVPALAAETAWIDNNRVYANANRRLVSTVEQYRLAALFDPQTNGGLLVAARPESVQALVSAGFSPIGHVTSQDTIIVDE